jgi:hypothetical protein
MLRETIQGTTYLLCSYSLFLDLSKTTHLSPDLSRTTYLCPYLSRLLISVETFVELPFSVHTCPKPFISIHIFPKLLHLCLYLSKATTHILIIVLYVFIPFLSKILPLCLVTST